MQPSQKTNPDGRMMKPSDLTDRRGILAARVVRDLPDHDIAALESWFADRGIRRTIK